MEDKNGFAYREIKKQILSGMLTNDSAISENKLVSMLDISRTPIRAALQRLQFEGFIKIIRNQGIVINEISMKEADQICDLRIALEQFMLAKSVPMLTSEVISALEQNLNGQRMAVEANGIERFYELDAEFHHLATQGYENAKIESQINNCRERFIAYHYMSYARQNRLVALVEEHQRIFDAIKVKDIEGVKLLIEKHISNGVMAMIRG